MTRHAVSHTAGVLRRALNWPARVGAARRAMSQLARMSDYELRDIGLTRQDVVDVSALPLDEDPTALLARREPRPRSTAWIRRHRSLSPQGVRRNARPKSREDRAFNVKFWRCRAPLHPP